MDAQADNAEHDEGPGRWVLLRDIFVFQLKLVVDGLRDFVLVPISLAVGLVSLVKAGNGGGNEFYELLRTGRRSERWINLFGAADRGAVRPFDDDAFPAGDIDTLMTRVESFVVEEYQRGGVTRQAKERLDQALDSLHDMASRHRRHRHGNSDNGTA